MSGPSEVSDDDLRGWLDTPGEELPRLSKTPRPRGSIKASPEDFRVTEVLGFCATGDGAHLLVEFEKVNASTATILTRLEKELGLRREDIGYAGQKDKVARTRQHVTVPKAVEAALAALEDDSLRIVSVNRHDRKLRLGDHEANAFEIVVRDLDGELQVEHGPVPAYYGAQRFGAGGSTLALGRRAFEGERIKKGRLFGLALSAVQSSLFNAFVAARVRSGTAQTTIDGDVTMRRFDDYAVPVTKRDETDRGLAAAELFISGPIFGPKMREARGAARDLENRVLEAAGLSRSAFTRFGKKTLGTRRPIAVVPKGLACERNGSTATLRFSLPPGAYATVTMSQWIDLLDRAVKGE